MPTLMQAFAELNDPRSRQCRYQLEEILLSTLCATLCGVDTWEMMVLWGRSQLEWLRKHQPYKHGIPCADTYRRVFGALSPVVFEKCFIKWVQTLCPSLADKHVAIDGKTLRGNRTGRACRGLHLVSAWCSDNGLSLGQVNTPDKSNEITAIPELLAALDLKGATITLDAMGTQHSIAESIVQAKADYVLAVKENQPLLCQGIQDWFDTAQAGKLKHSYWEHREYDKGHGRIETRVCRVTDDVEWLRRIGADWVGIKRLVKMENTREIGDKITTECRYYISSKEVKAKEMAALIRAHWGIENQLHWVLDMSWGEDACQVRDKNAARNLATLRKITLNMVRVAQAQYPTKVSLKGMRALAAWDVNMRDSILGLI